MNLSVSVGNVRFANPVTVASGTFGYEPEYDAPAGIKKLGAFTPKTVTLHSREGNPPPRICETPSGMLNAIGIENAGADDFVQNKLPAFKKLGVPLIISVLGYTDEEFIALTERMQTDLGVTALELNLSCPNLSQKNLVSQDPDAVFRVVQKVKQAARIPVIAKLTPNVTDIAAVAAAAESAGADAVTLVNTFAAMAIDVKTRRPVLGNVTGGLSGPAIKPAALYQVYRAARKIKIPIIGMGGIMTAEDALEFILAGATMVAVGTANFLDPRAPLDILDGIKKYMKEQKIGDIHELIGAVKERS